MEKLRTRDDLQALGERIARLTPRIRRQPVVDAFTEAAKERRAQGICDDNNRLFADFPEALGVDAGLAREMIADAAEHFRDVSKTKHENRISGWDVASVVGGIAVSPIYPSGLPGAGFGAMRIFARWRSRKAALEKLDGLRNQPTRYVLSLYSLTEPEPDAFRLTRGRWSTYRCEQTLSSAYINSVVYYPVEFHSAGLETKLLESELAKHGERPVEDVFGNLTDVERKPR